MIKYYCDACGEEHKQLHTFKIPIHLLSETGEPGYIDADGNSISGRMDSIDLCNRCLNCVYSKAVDEINQRLKERGL